VGGLTPSQQKEIFDRVEDAIASIKTTNVEGYIAGGGATLVYISNLMTSKLEGEEHIGYNLVKDVLLEPTKRILKNGNRQSSKNWWERVIVGYKDYLTPSKKEYGVGYNAVTDKISNLLEDGVIDSKKSIRIALESASERAIQHLNIGVLVSFPQSIEL
jgi:chaperonin GroEL